MTSPAKADRWAIIAHWRALASAAPGDGGPAGDHAGGGGAGGGLEGQASDEGGGGAGGGAGGPGGGPVRPGSSPGGGGVVSLTFCSSRFCPARPARARHANLVTPGAPCEAWRRIRWTRLGRPADHGLSGRSRMEGRE